MIRDDQGHFLSADDRRECLWCRVSLAGRRKLARWCSVKCRTYWVRRQRRVARVLEHPRCVVCSGPMPYRTKWQGPGVRLSAVTCSEACRRVRRRWLRPERVAA